MLDARSAHFNRPEPQAEGRNQAIFSALSLLGIVLGSSVRTYAGFGCRDRSKLSRQADVGSAMSLNMWRFVVG